MEKLEPSTLVNFITVTPSAFYPYLIVEFYANAEMAKDKNPFENTVSNVKFQISSKFITRHFNLSDSGVSIYTYLDNVENLEFNH